VDENGRKEGIDKREKEEEEEERVERATRVP